MSAITDEQSKETLKAAIVEDEFFIEAKFTQLRGRAPGYVLNDAQPVNDGNIYSLRRNEGDDCCWDLFQCSLTEDCNKVKVKRIFEAVDLNEVERIVYPYIERLGIYVEDHTVVALGLPTHFPNIRTGADAISNPGKLMAKIDYKVLAEDLKTLEQDGREALLEKLRKRQDQRDNSAAGQVAQKAASETRDPELQSKFEQWIDIANDVLKVPEACLSDDDIELIRSLSEAGKESEFLNFLIQLGKRPRRAGGNETDQEEPNKDLRFEIREEPVRWARELFGSRDLLSGKHIAIRLTRAYAIETLRKPLDVGLAMVLWGAIFGGAIVWLGSPWWTGVIFASIICLIIFVYLSTSRIRQIMQAANLAVTLSGGSGLLDDSNFMKSIGQNTEWTTRLNKVIEVIWGLGFLGLLPLMWLFFGAIVGIGLSICSLLIAFLFFLFTAKTNTRLFELAVEREKANRLVIVKEAKRGEGH